MVGQCDLFISRSTLVVKALKYMCSTPVCFVRTGTPVFTGCAFFHVNQAIRDVSMVQRSCLTHGNHLVQITHQSTPNPLPHYDSILAHQVAQSEPRPLHVS